MVKNKPVASARPQTQKRRPKARKPVAGKALPSAASASAEDRAENSLSPDHITAAEIPAAESCASTQSVTAEVLSPEALSPDEMALACRDAVPAAHVMQTWPVYHLFLTGCMTGYQRDGQFRPTAALVRQFQNLLATFTQGPRQDVSCLLRRYIAYTHMLLAQPMAAAEDRLWQYKNVKKAARQSFIEALCKLIATQPLLPIARQAVLHPAAHAKRNPNDRWVYECFDPKPFMDLRMTHKRMPPKQAKSAEPLKDIASEPGLTPLTNDAQPKTKSKARKQ